MKLESVGIIISLRPFAERDMIARIFTRDFGILTGMLKNAAASGRTRLRPMVGQFGNVSWNARLEQQLGTFHFESLRNMAAPIMSDVRVLSCMNSAFELLHSLLPECESYGALYLCTERLLTELAGTAGGDKIGESLYVNWEMMLLQELGYALNLTRCSNCGASENLTHISPKTGRAVCSNCAGPYLDKLLPNPPDLKTTQYFLSKAAGDLGLPGLPLARRILA